MRRIAVAVAVLGVLLTPGTAGADSPGCVTKAEWNPVDYGWQRERVERRFDTRGEVIVTGSTGYRELRYEACGDAVVEVGYDHGRVSHKGWTWI